MLQGGPETCIYPLCPDARVKGKPFCRRHARQRTKTQEDRAILTHGPRVGLGEFQALAVISPNTSANECRRDLCTQACRIIRSSDPVSRLDDLQAGSVWQLQIIDAVVGAPPMLRILEAQAVQDVATGMDNGWTKRPRHMRPDWWPVSPFKMVTALHRRLDEANKGGFLGCAMTYADARAIEVDLRDAKQARFADLLDVLMGAGLTVSRDRAG